MMSLGIFFALLLLACTSAARILKTFADFDNIVDGYTAHIAAHPYQVTLRFKNFWSPDDAYTHVCAGAIYSERVVITTANCIIGTVPSQWQVVAGTNYRVGNDGYIVPVQSLIRHEDYDPVTHNNDIAILVLGAALPLNHYSLAGIELARQDYSDRSGKMGIVSGWGSMGATDAYSQELQTMKLPIVTNKDCNESYDGQISDSMLCAGYRGNVQGKNTCQGDRGSPLVVDGKLVGIISWSSAKCENATQPVVFTNISYFRQWITAKINGIEFHY